MVQILSTLIAADGGEVRIAGHDVAREPDAVRARHRRHRSVLGRRRAVHRRGEPAADGGPATPRQGRRPRTRRRAARAVRSRRRREEAGHDLLRRHAAAPRPGDDPDRRSADHLPRRADGRTRSAQPARHVGDRSRTLVAERRDDLPDHAVPRGGGSARPSDRRPRPRECWSRRGRRTSSSASCPAATSSSRSATPPSSSGPPQAFDGASRDDESLTLQIPSDGGIGSLRALLDRLDADSIDVGELSVQTPDLDDVFLSLTGDHDEQKGDRPMTTYPLVLTDSATMLRRNLRRMRRYPSLTFFIAGIPVVFLLLFVYVLGGTLGAGLGLASRRPRRVHRVRRARDPPGHGRRRRPGHGDLGRDGHDRGHHRPVPDDGHRPRRRS